MGLSIRRVRARLHTALISRAALLMYCLALAAGALALAACVLAAASVRLASPFSTRAAGAADVRRLQSSWFGGEAFMLLQSTQTVAGIKTDRRVYAQPPLAEPSAAGQTYRDPVFGTLVMRATDSTDCAAPGCGTWYSNWPTFNSDDTRILVRNGVNGDVIIKSFDPVNFTVGPTLRATPRLKGTTPNWQSATWSHTDPDLLYVPGDYYNSSYPASGVKLYSYRPSTGAFALVKDFGAAATAGGADYFSEMHVDSSDNLFVLSQKRVGTGDLPVAFIVWRKSTDQILLDVPRDSWLDSRKGTPDKTGRWVVFPTNDHATQADGATARVWDSAAKTWQAVRWTSSDDAPSHGDMGTGVMVGHGNFTGAFNVRRLNDVHAPQTVFAVKDERGVTDWSYDVHTTMYADDESWVVVAMFDDPGWSGPGRTGAFENEVLQFSTDGSQRIRRLFHHRSLVDNKTEATGYWASPKPTVSRDGRFIAFTSNWGSSQRYDLFIAKIDPAPPLTKTAPRPGPASRPRRAAGSPRRGQVR